LHAEAGLDEAHADAAVVVVITTRKRSQVELLAGPGGA
jgi:hypothetical protein